MGSAASRESRTDDTKSIKSKLESWSVFFFQGVEKVLFLTSKKKVLFLLTSVFKDLLKRSYYNTLSSTTLIYFKEMDRGRDEREKS